MRHVDAFTTRRIGTSGCEIRDPDGIVVAWTAGEPWALLIACLLNRAEMEGVGDVFGWAVENNIRCGCPPEIRLNHFVRIR